MILLAIVLFVVGFALIIKCSDIFVDAASWVSDVTGISKVVIGATLVSFATAAPEFFVSTIAVVKGYNDLSVGNAVGSLSANLGVAFALLALFTPGTIRDRQFGLKGLVMIVSAAVLLLSCMNGTVSILEASVLLAMFAFSIYLNIRYSKEGEEGRGRKQVAGREILINTAKFVIGAAGIIFGSNLIVDNGMIIAARLGVSETVIGLTFVAIGTSLPEIVTSIAAIVKKQNDISLGNIFGANIIDATLILGVAGFITKGNLTVGQATVTMYMPVTLALMAIAVLPGAIGRRIYRVQGVLMAAGYFAYLVYLAQT